MPRSATDRAARSARRRLFAQALLDRLAAVAFAYHPVTDSEAWAELQQKRNNPDETKRTADAGKRSGFAADRKTKPERLDRANKSPKLKELEAEIDRLERERREWGRDP